MKRLLSILIAIMFLYNSAGYLIAFKSIQYGIKKEIKTKIKENLDEKELVLIKYPAHPDKQQRKLFHWKEKNEFIYNGNMYDVVRQYAVNDTIYFYCINDTKEKGLFGNLDVRVCQNMSSNAASKNIMKLFKLSVNQLYVFSFSTNNLHHFYKLTYYLYRTPGYTPFQKEVDTPPPELA